jgi:carbon starvation protein
MPLAVLALGALLVLVLGYVGYGRLVVRALGPERTARTPAQRLRDDVDFTPTPLPYLIGQHFSAIAAAGPIAGPILACTQFGWLPCLVWILLGVVFIGAVHDFTALFASVRHDARSVAEIARQYLGPRAGVLLLVFIWLALVYVVMAFTDITAGTFVGAADELAGITQFDPGGAVALSSTLYLAVAIVMGLLQRRFAPRLGLLTLIFVPATLVAVWAGTQASTWLVASARTWQLGILVYCVVASLLPMWALLQPRGYLGGFVLYLALAVGTLGVVFGGHVIDRPAFTQAPWFGLDGAPLFPFLFVTIACGACSGFHGLVCSGTTSKQVANETHCKPVGYGAMLAEAFVAVLALCTALVATDPKAPPGVIYADGLGRFLTQWLGPEHAAFARTFGAMAFSTFVFDTLDVAVRLGRYILCELFRWKGRVGTVVATLLTVGAPAALLLCSPPNSYREFWALFGTSNQLLAALTLLCLTVWLKASGKPTRFTVTPLLFILGVTFTALLLQTVGATRAAFAGPAVDGIKAANALAAFLLLALGVWLVVEAVLALRRRPQPVR